MQADHNMNGLYRIILIQNKLFLTLGIKSLLAKRGRRNGGGAAASGGLSRLQLWRRSTISRPGYYFYFLCSAALRRKLEY